MSNDNNRKSYDDLLLENDLLRSVATNIDLIVERFNKIAVEERDAMKRDNRRLTAENVRLQSEIEALVVENKRLSSQVKHQNGVDYGVV